MKSSVNVNVLLPLAARSSILSIPAPCSSPTSQRPVVCELEVLWIAPQEGDDALQPASTQQGQSKILDAQLRNRQGIDPRSKVHLIPVKRHPVLAESLAEFVEVNRIACLRASRIMILVRKGPCTAMHRAQEMTAAAPCCSGSDSARAA